MKLYQKDHLIGMSFWPRFMRIAEKFQIFCYWSNFNPVRFFMDQSLLVNKELSILATMAYYLIFFNYFLLDQVSNQLEYQLSKIVGASLFLILIQKFCNRKLGFRCLLQDACDIYMNIFERKFVCLLSYQFISLSLLLYFLTI